MLKHWTVLLIVPLVAGCALFNRDDNNKGNSPNRSGERISAPATSYDRQFVQEAGSRGIFLVQASQLAANDNALDAQHRQFAQMAVQEYGKLNQELTRIAREKGYDLRPEMLPGQQQSFAQLQPQKGPALARQYHAVVLDALDQLGKLYAQAPDQLADPDLKRLVQNAQAMIQQHRATLAQYTLPAAGGLPRF